MELTIDNLQTIFGLSDDRDKAFFEHDEATNRFSGYLVRGDFRGVGTSARQKIIWERLREVFGIRGPVFCNVEINPDQKLFPVLKYGHSLEDQMPLLEREKLDQILSM